MDRQSSKRACVQVQGAAPGSKPTAFQALPAQVHGVIMSMMNMSERIDSYLAGGGTPLVKSVRTIATQSLVMDAGFFLRYLLPDSKREATGKYLVDSGLLDRVRSLSIGTKTQRANVPPGFYLALHALTKGKGLEELKVFAGSVRDADDLLAYARAFLPTLRVLHLDLSCDGRMHGASFDVATNEFTKLLGSHSSSSSLALRHLGLGNTIWEGRTETQMLELVAALPCSLTSLHIQPRTTLSEAVLRALYQQCPLLSHLDVSCSFGLDAVPAPNWDRLPHRDWVSLRLRQHCRSLVPTMTAPELEALGGPLLRHFESNCENKGIDHKSVCRFLDKCPALETVKLHVGDLKPSFKEMALAMSWTAAAPSLRHFDISYSRPHHHSQRRPRDMSFASAPDLYRLFPKLRVYPAEATWGSSKKRQSDIVRVLADPARYNTMEFAQFQDEVLHWSAEAFGAVVTNSTRWKQLGIRYVSRLLSGTMDHKTMKHLVERCPDLSLCCLPMETELTGELLQQLLTRSVGTRYNDRLEWHLGVLSAARQHKLPTNTDIRLEHLVKRKSNREIALFNMILGGLSFDDLVILKDTARHTTKSEFGFIVMGDVADAFVKTFGARRQAEKSWLDDPDAHIVFPINADTSAVFRGEVVLTQCDHDTPHVVCLGTSRGISDGSLRWCNVPMNADDDDDD